MEGLRECIKTALREALNENKAYDDLLSLEDWYNEENDKLNAIKDFKVWKIKTKLLQKQYFNKKKEITKRENPFGVQGDMNAKYLYHYTDGGALISIINDNVLIGGGDEYGGISFSTHPNLYKRGFVFWYPNEYSKGRHHGNVGVKIKFDFDEMKNDGLKFRKGSENIGTHSGEDEIRLREDELENPIKYIKEIIIFKDKEKTYLALSNLLTRNGVRHRVV
ncbi:hypothetical protein E6Q11_06840 [Candidatus Dojkabacteria bacterium]|uniref:Uncharacterized protein n=1 Tax=Candidatus Dojkabacteria bacterium TaxID=2099670 RepID=A0A5C7J2L9_9BACT|nr:MAG: hypothetical protein E6Q11_06840 [Candidatus Dojkabacteria bacterium]